MYDYKILKIKQPFIHLPYKNINEYENFHNELLECFNAGYEIVHSEDVSYVYHHDIYSDEDKSNGKIFILRKPK